MKKQFLTLALLATVAVGGAFAGKQNSNKFLIPAGQLNGTVCTTNVDCTTINTGVPCSFSPGEDTPGTWYQNNEGECTTPLFRPL